MGAGRPALPWPDHWSARAACGVVRPEYGRAREPQYPAALDDARDVMKALLSDADPASTVMSGDSAGGGLALSLAIALRDEARELPAGCILLSPWLGLGLDRPALPRLVPRGGPRRPP